MQPTPALGFTTTWERMPWATSLTALTAPRWLPCGSCSCQASRLCTGTPGVTSYLHKMRTMLFLSSQYAILHCSLGFFLLRILLEIIVKVKKIFKLPFSSSCIEVLKKLKAKVLQGISVMLRKHQSILVGLNMFM